MDTPRYLTKSAFAAHRGVSPGYVTKLKDQGRLVMSPDGKRVDVRATEALLASTADPSKAGVAQHHERRRVERGVVAHLAPSAPPLDRQPDADLPDPDDDGIDFQKARARREHFLARLAENESLKSDGKLVEREAVENAAFTAGRLLRDLVLGLPKQISAELAAISDSWELERQLTAGLRRVLDEVHRLSSTDLEHSIKPPD